jgi:uncharacterized protein YciI
MAYFLLEYDLVPDYLERRQALRAEHLGLARAASERGELRLAGALSEPPDRALLIFESVDESAARAFVDADPYVKHGLVTAWRVRRWTVVQGADHRAAT